MEQGSLPVSCLSEGSPPRGQDLPTHSLPKAVTYLFPTSGVVAYLPHQFPGMVTYLPPGVINLSREVLAYSSSCDIYGKNAG